MAEDINKLSNAQLKTEVLSNWHKLNQVLDQLSASTVYKCLVLELAGSKRLGIVERLHTRFLSLRKKELTMRIQKFLIECEEKNYGVKAVEERLKDFYML